MRRVTVLVFLLLVSSAAFGESRTLGRDGVVGTWYAIPSGGLMDRIGRVFREPRLDTLQIDKNLSVRFERFFGDGQTQVLTAAPSAVQFQDDLMIVTFERPPLRARLVATGWQSGGTRLLLGQMYLYDNDGLFNGYAITFRP